jgi:tRNA 2-selenouridine synthase
MALHSQRQAPQIWLEAESAQVGRCRIPAGLWRQMQQAPLLEIQRPLAERLEQLVAVYGSQGASALREATERIARRLGPQRTAAALEAIDHSDWGGAARQMLDYYDRCYDHELARHPIPVSAPVDLEEDSAEAAAERLLALGRVQVAAAAAADRV